MATLTTRTCEHCGQTYQPRKPTQRGCSKQCGQRLRFPNTARKQRTCEQCDTTYNATHAAQRTCTRACGAALRRTAGSYTYNPDDACRRRTRWPTCKVHWNNCELCGHTFAGKRSTSRTCARHDQNEVRRTLYQDKRRPPPDYTAEHTCHECGQAFTVNTRGIYKWCSSRCWKRAYKRNRKHLLRSRSIGERFTTYQIAERDGWRCHLCHKRVTRKQASIDHLIPLSAGGLHTRNNVALAHHRCNTLRRNTGPAQLLLFG